jgi:hypothetical protein
MLTYVYFGTNDLERATAFYDATLAPLGMKRCITGDPEWDRISAGWGIYEDDGARELAFWSRTRPWRQVRRRSRSAIELQPGLLRSLRARSRRQ